MAKHQINQFGTKIGLIAATVGSAVGLGTIWRFPAEVQSGGGAAFLLLYVVCVFLLAIPVMLSEFALGRSTREDAVGAYRKLSPDSKWWMAGGLAVVSSYLIMCFYMVVGGWTLEYLLGAVSGDLFEPFYQGQGAHEMFNGKMQEYVSGGWSPIVNTCMIIIINIGVLVCGVQKGIERMSNIMMPLLYVSLCVIMGYVLCQPGSFGGVEYFFKPDFSKITPGVMVGALGQALFSLSLGMGILITYSSYFPSDTRLTRTSVIVSVMTLVVAVMMGLIIFPAMSAFGMNDANHCVEGTTLVFVTLPEVFMCMEGGRVWAVIFFSLLLLAALTSTVSIAEVSVAFVGRRFKLSRFKSTLLVLLPLLLFSSICAMSFGPLENFKIGGYTIFDGLDTLTNNIMLPVVALLGVIFVGWVAPRKLMRDQLTNNGAFKSVFESAVMFVIRYIAPVVILVILISNIL